MPEGPAGRAECPFPCPCLSPPPDSREGREAEGGPPAWASCDITLPGAQRPSEEADPHRTVGSPLGNFHPEQAGGRCTDVPCMAGRPESLGGTGQDGWGTGCEPPEEGREPHMLAQDRAMACAGGRSQDAISAPGRRGSLPGMVSPPPCEHLSRQLVAFPNSRPCRLQDWVQVPPFPAKPWTTPHLSPHVPSLTGGRGSGCGPCCLQSRSQHRVTTSAGQRHPCRHSLLDCSAWTADRWDQRLTVLERPPNPRCAAHAVRGRAGRPSPAVSPVPVAVPSTAAMCGRLPCPALFVAAHLVV